MTYLRAAFARFRSDDRGAMAYLGVIGAIPLLMCMFYIVNSASAIQDKTRNQDAADMIALVHAAEAARSLNTVGMNQVTMTQAFATGVTSGSLIPIIHTQALMAAAAGAVVVGYMAGKCAKRYKFLKAIPIVGAALFAGAFAVCEVPSLLFAARMAAIVAKVELILLEFDVMAARTTSANAIDALNAMNDEIYRRFPEAVSVQAEQIAKEFKVRNIYFDDSCANGTGNEPRKAGSCNTSDKRQGMNLPMIKTPEMSLPKRVEAHARFCSALHFGTAGFQLPSLPLLSTILPGGIGASAMNGSYLLRGFDAFEGPLAYGGTDETNHLRDHVNDVTEIGEFVTQYYDEVQLKTVYDGLLNLWKLPTDSARTAIFTAEAGMELAESLATPPDFDTEEARENLEEGLDSGALTLEEYEDAIANLDDGLANVPAIGAKKPTQVGALNWPTEQTEDDNVYKDLVNLRVANMCGGDPIGGLTGGLFDGLGDFLGSVTGALPNINVWHPADEGMLPSISPQLDDFSDKYKVVAFSQRTPNNRWTENVFGNPTDHFFAFSQAAVINPDEIGLFSQNWEGIMTPARKMEDSGGDIVQRMQNVNPDGFADLATRLNAVVGEGDWANVVVR